MDIAQAVLEIQKLMYVNYVITDFYVPTGGKYCGCLGKKSEYKIPVGAVIRIGVDSILVDIDEKKCLVKQLFSGIITGTINVNIRDRNTGG